MLNSKQRSYLRSLASSIDTIFQIGKGGITEELCTQLENALEARELIKMEYMKLEEGRIAFTDSGFLVSNSILSDMLEFDA